MKKVLILTLITFLSGTALAENSVKEAQAKGKVKYKSSGRIDFESLLIEGERKKPEMAVVTGNIGEKDSGLLKFRKHFLDVMADDFGEAVE